MIAAPGERFVYSDVGFQILGRLVERISGQSLDRFASERIFRPVGMADAQIPAASAGWLGSGKQGSHRSHRSHRARAPGAWFCEAASTIRAPGHGRGRWARRALRHRGRPGAFAQTLLGGGRSPGGRRLMAPLTVRAMFDPGTTSAGEKRGLGWDVATRFSSPRGALFGPESLGHTGFTGTSLWIDPETQTFVVLLTSHLHPDEKTPPPVSLRADVSTLAAAAIVDAQPRVPPPAGSMPGEAAPVAGHRQGEVRCGIDVLIEDRFATLRGQRVGLVTNQTGRTRDGKATIDVLHHAPR